MKCNLSVSIDLMSLPSTFRALVTRAKKSAAAVEVLQSATDLPKESSVKKASGPCGLTVAVDYSSLNYKDAMVATGKYPGLPLPMVGGIDLMGRVVSCEDGQFKEGDPVLANCFGMGTDHFGGFSELARIRTEWAIPLGKDVKISTLDAARIGCAGFTAMICVSALEERGLQPGSGPVLVTGATGGVGSVSVAILSELGYEVVAATGKVDQSEDWLKKLGAKEVIAR